MSQPKPVRGSPNYVWFTGQILGKGAMGAVVLARHRKRGTKCAAKVFSKESKAAQKKYIQRELEILQRMEAQGGHTCPNIIKLLAIEEETYSKDTVIIMELCDGGSLQQILDEPHNYYGLCETELLLVFKHICKALHHLYDHHVVHRDVKPGNILCQVAPDGSHVYKLTDFGAATSITDEDDSFKSLCGTEEYLHPEMHNAAFIRRVPGRVFGPSVDLWSFGVTIYQCATGKLPFRPRDGVRQDKQTMQKLMIDKAPGVISQTQRTDGTFHPESNLPQTCQLNDGTRHWLVEILGRIFNVHPDYIWKPDSFYREMDDFCSRLSVYVFSYLTNTYITVFLQPLESLVILRDELTKFIQIGEPAIFYTSAGPLEADCIRDCPEFTHQDPVYLLSNFAHHDPFSYHIPNLPDDTVSSEENLAADAKWAKEISGNMHYLERAVNYLILLQRHLLFVRKTIIDKLLERCRVFELALATQQSRHDHQFSLSAVIISHMVRYHKDSQKPATMGEYISRLDQGVKKCRADKHDIEHQYVTIEDSMRRYLLCLKQGLKPDCDVKDKCKQKAEIFINDTIPMFHAILDDNHKGQLTHNDMEIHRYNKSELKRIHKRMRELAANHCLAKTLQLHKEHLKLMRDITETENTLKKLEIKRNTLDSQQQECEKHILEMFSCDFAKGPGDISPSSLSPPVATVSPQPSLLEGPRLYTSSAMGAEPCSIPSSPIVVTNTGATPYFTRFQPQNDFTVSGGQSENNPFTKRPDQPSFRNIPSSTSFITRSANNSTEGDTPQLYRDHQRLSFRNIPSSTSFITRSASNSSEGDTQHLYRYRDHQIPSFRNIPGTTSFITRSANNHDNSSEGDTPHLYRDHQIPRTTLVRNSTDDVPQDFSAMNILHDTEQLDS